MFNPMDSTNLRAFFLFSWAFLLHLQSTSCSTPTKTGFSVELIYRDSINSPLYPGNLTDAQMARRRMGFAKAHALATKSSTVGARSGGSAPIRPILLHDGLSYMVKLRIGSPGVELYLFIDTGSSITWTQMSPCKPCFPQTGPKYKPSESSTYTPVLRDNPLCEDYDENGFCIFSITYVDGAHAEGSVGRDIFNVTDDTATFVGHMIFGLASSTSRNIFKGKIGGTLGLGRGPPSFVMQLAPYQDTSRFAVCMIDKHFARSGYIRFGSDIKELVGAQSTPLIISEDYHVNLVDIAINGKLLNLPPGTFALQPNGTGGCIVDTGSTTSALITPAYDAFTLQLTNFFLGHNLQRFYGKDLGYEYCFQWLSSYPTADYPTVDFHFDQGAVLHVGPNDMFFRVVSRRMFCLDMIELKTVTLIGAAHQQNHLFVYDLQKNMLHFAPDNCLIP